MISRIFLTAVGLMYIGLALWCSFDPKNTSQKVGFELLGDTGQSEFLTVYGGLEFGMALVFLVPLMRPEMHAFSLLACVLIHGSLVAFRSLGFFLYPDVGSMTQNLAIGEWVIFLLSSALLIWKR